MRWSVYPVPQISVLAPSSFFDAKREASLDELSSLFQWNIRCGRKKHVEMIGHENELMQFEFLLRAILFQSVEEEMRHGLGAKDRTALPGSCGHEEGADLLRGMRHSNWPGLKPESIQDSFHHAKAWCFHPEKEKLSTLSKEEGLLRASLSCQAHSPMSSVSVSVMAVTGRCSVRNGRR